MIEVTDEMIAAFEQDGTGGWGDITDTRAGLAAVLAIVERDQQSTCQAVVETRGAFVRCKKSPDGHDTHLGRHGGWDVVW